MQLTYDQLRLRVAEIIAAEREISSISGSASLAGLDDDEWTADRILKFLCAQGITIQEIG